MSATPPVSKPPHEIAVASYDFLSGPLRGTQLMLFGTRLLHQGAGQMESIALGAVASVRVGYDRDPNRIGWGAALLFVALVFFLSFRGLAAMAAGTGAEVLDTQAVGQVLRAVFRALEILAGVLMPLAGAAFLAWGAWLIAFGWIGVTTLVLMLPAGERHYAVRGSNPLLAQFAEVLAERVAHRPR